MEISKPMVQKYFFVQKSNLSKKSGLLNLSEFLMMLIDASIIEEIFSKLNLQFPNNKIFIILIFKMLSSIVSNII